MARPRIYEGTESQRKTQATAAWNKKNMKQLNIRIDPILFERLEKEAKRRHRSLRNYCIFKLSADLNCTQN